MVKLRKTKQGIRRAISKKEDRFAGIKPKTVRICHKCGSLDVHLVHDYRGKAPPSYECRTCEHVDHSFPEVDAKDIEHFRKNLHRHPIQKRRPVRRHEPRAKPSKGLLIGVGILLCIIGAIAMITEVAGDLTLLDLVWSIILMLAGAAMIVSGIKGKKRYVNLNP